MVSTPLKNICQIGSFPQIGVKIKTIWNHHLAFFPNKNTHGVSDDFVFWGWSHWEVIAPRRWRWNCSGFHGDCWGTSIFLVESHWELSVWKSPGDWKREKVTQWTTWPRSTIDSSLVIPSYWIHCYIDWLSSVQYMENVVKMFPQYT